MKDTVVICWEETALKTDNCIILHYSVIVLHTGILCKLPELFDPGYKGTMSVTLYLNVTASHLRRVERTAISL